VGRGGRDVCLCDAGGESFSRVPPPFPPAAHLFLGAGAWVGTRNFDFYSASDN